MLLKNAEILGKFYSQKDKKVVACVISVNEIKNCFQGDTKGERIPTNKSHIASDQQATQTWGC